MKRLIGCGAALGLMSLLAACSEAQEPQNNPIAQDVNAMTSLDGPAAEPAANAVVEVPAEPQSEPAAKPAPKPASDKPAPAKPKPPAPVPAPETNASDPTCLPEHRAAGHC